MSKIKDITGNKFGYLIALAPTEKRICRNVVWKCQCECGNTCYATAHNLRKGKTGSCGCIQRSMFRQNRLNKKTEQKRKEVLGLIDGTMIAMLNEKPTSANKSGVRGVFWDSSSKKWVAKIYFKGKQYYLGRYEEKKDAVKARNNAENELWKPFVEEHCNDKKIEFERCEKPQEV